MNTVELPRERGSVRERTPLHRDKLFPTILPPVMTKVKDQLLVEVLVVVISTFFLVSPVLR